MLNIKIINFHLFNNWFCCRILFSFFSTIDLESYQSILQTGALKLTKRTWVPLRMTWANVFFIFLVGRKDCGKPQLVTRPYLVYLSWIVSQEWYMTHWVADWLPTLEVSSQASSEAFASLKVEVQDFRYEVPMMVRWTQEGSSSNWPSMQVKVKDHNICPASLDIFGGSFEYVYVYFEGLVYMNVWSTF